MFEVESRMGLMFCIEKFNEEGTLWSSDWFNNTILNVGLDQLRNYSISSSTKYLNVGTGMSEPDITRTNLDIFHWKSVLNEKCGECSKDEWDNTIETFREENERMVNTLEEMLRNYKIEGYPTTSPLPGIRILISEYQETFGDNDFVLEDMVTLNDSGKEEWKNCDVLIKVFDDYIARKVFVNDSDTSISSKRVSTGVSTDDPLYFEYVHRFVYDIGTFDFSSLSGEENYSESFELSSPIISEFGISFGDNASNTSLFNRQLVRNLVSVIDEVIGIGDDSTKSFTYSTNNHKVEPNTIQIYVHDVSDGSYLIITDDGKGNLIGDVDTSGNNTVDYHNGDLEFTFSEAPTSNKNISDNYNIKINYEWWEPCPITLLEDEGLRVFIKARYFPWLGEGVSYTYSGSFEFEDEQGEETYTVNYTASINHSTSCEMGNFGGGLLSLYDDSDNHIVDLSPDSTTFVSASDRDDNSSLEEVTFIYESPYSSPTFDGYIQSAIFDIGDRGTNKINFDFDSTIRKRDNDQLTVIVSHSWAKYDDPLAIGY